MNWYRKLQQGWHGECPRDPGANFALQSLNNGEEKVRGSPSPFLKES